MCSVSCRVLGGCRWGSRRRRHWVSSGASGGRSHAVSRRTSGRRSNLSRRRSSVASTCVRSRSSSEATSRGGIRVASRRSTGARSRGVGVAGSRSLSRRRHNTSVYGRRRNHGAGGGSVGVNSRLDIVLSRRVGRSVGVRRGRRHHGRHRGSSSVRSLGSIRRGCTSNREAIGVYTSARHTGRGDSIHRGRSGTTSRGS